MFSFSLRSQLDDPWPIYQLTKNFWHLDTPQTAKIPKTPSRSMSVCLPVTIQEALIRIELDLTLENSVKCVDVLQLWLNPR